MVGLWSSITLIANPQTPPLFTKRGQWKHKEHHHSSPTCSDDFISSECFARGSAPRTSIERCKPMPGNFWHNLSHPDNLSENLQMVSSSSRLCAREGSHPFPYTRRFFGAKPITCKSYWALPLHQPELRGSVQGTAHEEVPLLQLTVYASFQKARIHLERKSGRCCRAR